MILIWPGLSWDPSAWEWLVLAAMADPARELPPTTAPYLKSLGQAPELGLAMHAVTTVALAGTVRTEPGLHWPMGLALDAVRAGLAV